MNQTERGSIAESIAATWALKQGWVVCWPSRGQSPRYDLVMDDNKGKLWRVQVKRAYLKGEHLTANLFRRGNIRYTPEDIDVLLIVDVSTESIWWVPIEDTENKGRVRLGTPHMERHRVTTQGRRGLSG